MQITKNTIYNGKLGAWIAYHAPLMVVAGHYSIADYLKEVSNTGGAEITSFKIGVHLISRASALDNAARLILLINDIGVDEKKRRSFRSDFQLPENYADVMAAGGLGIDKLVVVFESSVRNKASTLLRKLYKRFPQIFERRLSNEKGLIRCVDKSSCDNAKTGFQHAYVINGPRGEKLVVKDGPNPKCNLILATFFRDIGMKFRPRLIVNIFNCIYQRRVNLGLYVGRKIYNNSIPMLNLFCDEADIIGHDMNKLELTGRARDFNCVLT